MTSAEMQKRRAAEAAVAEIEPDMIVGLGTGSTADFAIRALGQRVAEGLAVTGIPTSERSAALARELGIPLGDADEVTSIDVTIDGADEVERGSLMLVKGLGGALLREKIVAAMSRRMLVIVDESKLVDRLGSRAPVPVEIVAFGRAATLARLGLLATKVELRRAGSTAFQTDGGNLIADCHTGPIEDPRSLGQAFKAITGVVETGLFIGLVSRILVGTADGVLRLDKTG